MKNLLILAISALATVAVANEKPTQPQSNIGEAIQEVMLLRLSLTDFYADPTTDAARDIQSRWQNISADIRNQIDRRHMGTELRILNLESEVPPPAPPETNTVTEVDAPAVPTVNEDVWAQTTPATSPRQRPVIYRDELDIFGDRPRPTRPRPARKSPTLQLAPSTVGE
ncbi:MAG: hypothetical protein PCFJNLEI_00396 [Verrucomicrobiae bacterium]|nr:hypothetical protein [Verrucomicrobiae bacterium]